MALRVTRMHARSPRWKKALEKERDEGLRQRIMHALLATHGMSEMEQVAALEEFATKMTIPEARRA